MTRLEPTRTHLLSLVEMIYYAYKVNPYFYEEFAWSMWADAAERELGIEKRTNAA